MNKRVFIGIGAILLLVGVIAAACSTDTDDLESRIEALEQQSSLADQVSALETQVQRGSMVAALNLLDDVGFHDLNQTIEAESIAPSGTVGKIRTSLRAVAVTDWPDGLAEGAADFQQELQMFLNSLLDESPEIVDTSLAAHDGYHDFVDRAWTFLAESAGLTDDGGGDDHGDGSDDGTMDGMHNEHMDGEPPAL